MQRALCSHCTVPQELEQCNAEGIALAPGFDLDLTFGACHVCWEYGPRRQKGLLPFGSAHSKAVERGIALAAIQNADISSCQHTMTNSLDSEVNRPRAAGYPVPLLRSSAENVLKRVNTNMTTKWSQEKAKGHLNVIPHVHGVSHLLKKTGDKVGVKTVSSIFVCHGERRQGPKSHMWKKTCEPICQMSRVRRI